MQFILAIKKWALRHSASLSIGLMTIAAIFIIVAIVMPDTYKLRSPVVVITGDCQEAFPLTIGASEDLKSEVTFEVGRCKDKQWQYFMLQTTNDDSHSWVAKVTINGKTITIPFECKSKDTCFSERLHDNQFMIKKDKLLAHINNIEHSTNIEDLTFSFKSNQIFAKRDFNTVMLRLVYFATNTSGYAGEKVGDEDRVIIKVSVPHVFSPEFSVPSADSYYSFDGGSQDLNNNVIYTYRPKANESGVISSFTNESRRLYKEVIFFVVSGIFGFLVGYLAELILKRSTQQQP